MTISDSQKGRSSKPHRAALDHLVEVFPSGRPITVSIDGLPAFEITNNTARRRLAAALDRVIEIEITQMAIEDAQAGRTTPLEQVKAELESEDFTGDSND